jgi:signal peptidase II
LKRAHLVIFITLAIILLDQCLKIWVKTHMYLGYEIPILSHYGYLHFTENAGMAFGIELGGPIGKYALSIFRIIASIFIIKIIIQYLKNPQTPIAFFIGMSMILAGAIGNVIDCIFYGLIFQESDYLIRNIATFASFGHGYATAFQGKVVDMLYFPLYEGFLPLSMPNFLFAQQ